MVGVAWQGTEGLTTSRHSPCHQIGLAMRLMAISLLDKLLGSTDQSLSVKSVPFTHSMTASLSWSSRVRQR